ncbi:MAG: flagellar type III secretion system pore protein FliP [Oscillospiraceae bacterium]
MEPQVPVHASSVEDTRQKNKKWLKLLTVCLCLAACGSLFTVNAFAAAVDVSIDTNSAGGGFDSLKLLFTFALIAVAPSLLVMMTSFTRIVIVFSFLRNALGLQQTPPNQVIIGLSLFLSFFIMYPVLTDMNDTAVKPYTSGEITQEVAIDKIQIPIKKFMLKQTKPADLNLFLSLSKDKETITEINPDQLLGLGLEVIVPSFITSELKRAFLMGFLLFLPFLVIDMIVASTLMSMGMVMLPPSMISLPFKLILFVVVNGWSLIMEMLVISFY